MKAKLEFLMGIVYAAEYWKFDRFPGLKMKGWSVRVLNRDSIELEIADALILAVMIALMNESDREERLCTDGAKQTMSGSVESTPPSSILHPPYGR